MSTYTQDINQLIHKIETNIPDNDTQYITAARIRDAMGAVAYNYDLYVLKTELDTAGYVTASALSGYATQEDLQTGMQSVLDDSYAYVVDKINEIPGVDLSAYVDYDSLQSYLGSYVTKSQLSQELGSYVTKTELSAMGYITEAALDGLATEAYVEDYVAHHTPMPDLSAYVTKTELSAAGYLTAVPSEYVTDTELSGMGYITSSDLPDMSAYVSQDDLQSALEPYVTESQLQEAGYATKTYVADYVATHSGPIDLSAYVTKDELSQASYATTTELNTAISGIVVPTKTSDLTNDSGFITSIPAEYITQTELESELVQYVTESEIAGMGYVTATALSNMGYITANELPDMSSYATLTYLESYYATLQEVWDGTDAIRQIFIDANILVGDPESGDWVTQAMASETYVASQVQQSQSYMTGYVADYVAEHAPMPDLSAYVTKTELSAAGYITYIPNNYATYDAISQMGYITLNDVPVVDLSSYVTKSQLSQELNSYVTKTELSNAGYLTSIPSEYVTYDAISQMGYITSIPSDYATYDAISQMSYVTNTSLQSQLQQAGYITSSDIPAIPVIDENLIPNTTNTYTLGDNSHRYNATYSYEYNFGFNTKLYSSSDYNIIVRIGNNRYQFDSTTFTHFDNSTTSSLGTSSKQWGYTYSADFIENGTNIKDIYTQAYVLTQSQYDGLSQSDKDKETIYIISDQQAYMNNELVTETSLDSRGFLTAANFNYDPVTQTLVLNL